MRTKLREGADRRVVNALFVAALFIVGVPAVRGGDRVLSVDEALSTPLLHATLAEGPPPTLVFRVLSGWMADAGRAMQAETARWQQPQELKAWQERTRSACVQALGGLPQRTPLNPRVTGRIEREGYAVEKILFESRPGLYVTALLFLPDPVRFAPPYAGVLIPCGHSNEGKGLPGYQRGGVLAAMNGIAALIYDPIDQGERLQGIGNGGVHGHNITGIRALLLGWNTASFRIWDGMRALDYLASRPEIDPHRLGCMGNSGGGTLTAYLTALDPRIKASSPACYISSLQQVCATIGPQDAEQNIFGQMAFGLEHAGWLLLRAPVPVCVCAAEKDFFPIAGTRQSVAEVRSVYARLGLEERFKLVTHEGSHGWAEPLRLAAVGWMNRWLRQSGELTVPPETETGLPGQEFWVTPTGQVRDLPGACSVYDLMRDEAVRLDKKRAVEGCGGLPAAVRSCAVIRPLADLPVPVTVTHSKNRYALGSHYGEVRHLVFKRENGLMIPSVFFRPDKMRGDPVIVVDGGGKSNAVAAVGVLLAEGRAVLAADLSGFGETYGSAHTFYGSEKRDEELAVLAYLLGRSLVGIRAEDLLICARWLGVTCETKRVAVHAANWAVTPAVHAAVAESGVFSAFKEAAPPPSWHEVMAGSQRHRFSDVVHGAWPKYDLEALKRTLPMQRE